METETQTETTPKRQVIVDLTPIGNVPVDMKISTTGPDQFLDFITCLSRVIGTASGFKSKQDKNQFLCHAFDSFLSDEAVKLAVLERFAKRQAKLDKKRTA